MKYANAPPDKQVGEFQWNHQALLGSGAFGKVFVGKSLKTNELVAIKMLSKSNLTDPLLIKALENEIMIMKTIKGPNVVTLYDVLHTKNNTYMIQELCDGGDLRFAMNQRGKIGEQEVRKVFRDILTGMKVMVDNNFVHRDLKPENILINKGVYKVADYGFARYVENYGGQMLTTILGTPLYMSPQILMKKEYTTKSDIWSLGIIYFEMLYGKAPWFAKSQGELCTNIRKNPLQFPCHISVSEESTNFIKGCLSVEEKDRFSWTQVFSHPVYVNFESKIKTQPLPPIDTTNKNILIELQGIIRNFDVDVDCLFDKFDLDSEGTLSLPEFKNILRVIDKKVSDVEAEKIFKIFDVNNDRSLSKTEFKRLLVETDYREENDDSDNYSFLAEKANRILKRLTDIIFDNRLDLKKIFNKFDKSGDRNLSESEMALLLKHIDEGITDKDVNFIFKKFDVNGDGSVTMEEFYNFFKSGKNSVKPAGVVSKDSKDHYPPGASTLVQKMMKELKEIISINQIDLKLVFKNFDTSHDNKLSKSEFVCLIKIINSRYYDSEIEELFNAFDSDGDKTLSFEEFSKHLK